MILTYRQVGRLHAWMDQEPLGTHDGGAVRIEDAGDGSRGFPQGTIVVATTHSSVYIRPSGYFFAT